MEESMEVTSGVSATLTVNLATGTLIGEEEVIVASTTTSDTAEQGVGGPSRPAKQKKRARKAMKEQPTSAYLAKLGIKVRDFAFEQTTLPPVRTIYRHPRQIQPSVNRSQGLQRQSTETAEDGMFSQPSQGSSQPLERTVTEPVLTPPPTRRQGFLNLKDYIHTDQNISLPQPAPSVPTVMIPQMILSHPGAENANEIKTPLVTPNGSLLWDLPLNNKPSASTSSPAPETETLTKSSSQHSISSSRSRLNIISALSSPLSSAPSSPGPFSSSLRSQQSSTSSLRRQTSRPVTPRDVRNQKRQEKPATTRRYDLRKRTANAIDPPNPKPAKRMKHTPAEPTARPQAISPPSTQMRSSSRRLPLSPMQDKRAKHR